MLRQQRQNPNSHLKRCQIENSSRVYANCNETKAVLKPGKTSSHPHVVSEPLHVCT